jgi:hypothetical protein
MISVNLHARAREIIAKNPSLSGVFQQADAEFVVKLG